MSLLKIIFALISLVGVNSSSDAPPQQINIEVPAPTVQVESRQVAANTDVDAIAQCLTEKGVKFYGAFWCPHCADQKTMFGDAMQYIEYIECDPRGENAQPDACDDAEIVSYPTWIFPNGERLVGTQQPQVLAQKAGCV